MPPEPAPRPAANPNRRPGPLPRLLKVRPAEARAAVLLFLYFFLVTSPFYIVKSLRDASYLDDLGARNLPYAYATALLIGAVVALHARLQSRISRRALIQSSLAFFVLTTLLFWLLFQRGAAWLGDGFRKWLPLPFYMWASVFAVVLTTQFWFCVNDIFNPRQAKRLIGLFGSGGILGGVAGALLTGLLAKRMNPYDLLPVAAALLALGMAAVEGLFRSEHGMACAAGADSAGEGAPRERGDVGFRASFKAVRSDRYLVLLAAAIFVAGLVSTLIDWQVKSVIETAEVASANFAAFFGRLNAGLLVFAFLFQLLLTSRVIGLFGLRPAMMVYPAVLLAGTLGLAFAPGLLLLAVLLKGSDKALSYSIYQSTRELLYIPVPEDLKYQAKAFIDMFLNRLARTAGALLLLPLILVSLPASTALRWAAVLTGAGIAAWGLLNLRIGRAYLGIVKNKLGRTWERADEVLGGVLDVATAKRVVDALEDRHRSETLYALDLFDLARGGKLSPAVEKLLAAEVPEPSAPSRGLLFDADEAPLIPERLERLPPETLDRTVREIQSLDSYKQLMGEYARWLAVDESPSAETSKMELAKAVGFMPPDSPAADVLEELLAEDSPDVVRIAAVSAGELGRRESVPALVRRLADPRTREEARAALERYGDRIAGELEDALADPASPLEVRREAAAILARAASQAAADALLRQLEEGPAELEADLVDALDRVRVRNREAAFDEGAVERRILEAAGRLGASRRTADALPVFKLLGLLYVHEDVFRAYASFRKAGPDETAYAVELLDGMLRRELKERLLPALEGLAARADEERA